jgi:alkylhydroperoxidase family enzyme
MTSPEISMSPALASSRRLSPDAYQLASIQQDQIQSFAFNVKERKLLQFSSRIAASHTLSRDHFEEARKHFSNRELVEIVAVRGFYYTVAMLASVFELESDFSWN